MNDINISICKECGTELKIGDYPFCNKEGGHESIYAVNAQRFDPVVIHKDANGKIRFPGSSDAPCPPGFQRVELTTVSQVRQLEREVNRKELSNAENNRFAQRAVSQAEAKERREKFREVVQGFSPRGRKFAEAIMTAKDRHKGRLDRPITDMGFRVDAFSSDSSNRERYSDSRTGWRGRKD